MAPGSASAAGRAVLFARVQALDALDADQALALPETDQAHALGVAPLHRDLVHRGAHQRAARADQHDFLARHDLQRRHGVTVAIRGLQRDHALAAAAVRGKLRERRQLAVAVGGGGEHRTFADHDQRDQLLSGAEADAAHAGRLAPHVAHLVLVEADRLAAARYQHDLAVAVGERHAHQLVVVVQVDAR